jgi:hypothetical protein
MNVALEVTAEERDAALAMIEKEFQNISYGDLRTFVMAEGNLGGKMQKVFMEIADFCRSQGVSDETFLKNMIWNAVSGLAAVNSRPKRREISYPCRCRIVDPTGEEVAPGVIGNAPDVSKPKIGRHGTAYKEGATVRIELDDGGVLMGYECWWEPIADTN